MTMVKMDSETPLFSGPISTAPRDRGGTQVHDTICPFCGAYSRRSCEMEDETGVCAWEDATEEPDPDRLREDRDERSRLDRENPND